MNYGLTRLSVCESIPMQLRNSTLIYEWNILEDGTYYNEDGSNYRLTSDCQIKWTAPAQVQPYKIPLLQ